MFSIVVSPQLLTDWKRHRASQYFQFQYGILWRAASFYFCQQPVSAIDTRRPHRPKSIAAGRLNYRVAFGADNDEGFRPFSVFPFDRLSAIFTKEHTISLLKVQNEPPPDPPSFPFLLIRYLPLIHTCIPGIAFAPLRQTGYLFSGEFLRIGPDNLLQLFISPQKIVFLTAFGL